MTEKCKTFNAKGNTQVYNYVDVLFSIPIHVLCILHYFHPTTIDYDFGLIFILHPMTTPKVFF